MGASHSLARSDEEVSNDPMARTRNKDLIAGCICGALCALCVGVHAATMQGEAKAAEAEMLARYGGDQVQVCVARHDIAAGQTISESDTEERTWVASLLPADAITDKKEAIGKQVGSTILAGEVIASARFGFDASSIDVPAGMHAVSVPAREVHAVGGALSPGALVDVYAIGPSATARIASSALVLATSASQDRASTRSDAWVTLAIEPSHVQELVQAAEAQTLYFALPSEDDAPAKPSDMTVASAREGEM